MEARTQQLRQMTLSEILDGAISIVRAHFTDLVKIVAVVLVPVQVIGFIILLVSPEATTDFLIGSTDSSGQTTFDENGDTVDIDWAAFWAGVAYSFLNSFAVLIATAAAYRFVSEAYLGFTIDWRESISYAFRKLHSLLWIVVLLGLGITVGFLFLIIPGIWLAFAWALAIPVLLSEDARGSKALGRSFKLVRHHWWKTFGTLFVAFLIVSLIQAGLGAVVGLVTADTSSQAFDAFLTSVLYVVLYLISTPFTTAVLALIYFDLRVRKEGVDLSMAAEGIGAGAAAGGTQPPPLPGQPPAAPPPPPPPPPPKPPAA